jgi:carbon monoxide dehydrogenase subunit G
VDANRQAPVFAESEIEIVAVRDAVWDVLTDFERWPSWNPDVKSLSLGGEVAPGTQFRWKAGGASITSTLERVERPHLVAWRGRTFGASAIHVYRLDGRDGITVVHTEESFEGSLARLFRRRLQTTVQTSLDTGLQHLKAEVERAAARR